MASVLPPSPVSANQLTPEQRKVFEEFKRIVFNNVALTKPAASNGQSQGYWNSVSSWWYGGTGQQQQQQQPAQPQPQPVQESTSITSSLSSWWYGSSSSSSSSNSVATTTNASKTESAGPTAKDTEEARSYWETAGSAVATLADDEVKRFMYMRDDDALLLRFVSNCNYDLEKAVQMFRNFLRWRIDFKVDEITKEYLLSIAHPGKPGKLLVDDEMVLLMGHDKQGHATIYLQVAKIEPGIYNYDDIIRCFVYVMELFTKRNVRALNLMFNYHEWGLSNVDRELDKRLLHVGQHYYPGILNMALLVDSPWIFRGVWSVISLFLQESVTSRIKMVYQEEVLQFYDADQITRAFGGQCAGFSIKEFIVDPDAVIARISKH